MLVRRKPLCSQTASHSQSAHDVGVLPQGIGENLSLRVAFSSHFRRRFRSALRRESHGADRGRAARRNDPDYRVKNEQRDQEQRHPGHIEKRRRPGAGKKGAHLIEITQGLLR